MTSNTRGKLNNPVLIPCTGTIYVIRPSPNHMRRGKASIGLAWVYYWQRPCRQAEPGEGLEIVSAPHQCWTDLQRPACPEDSRGLHQELPARELPLSMQTLRFATDPPIYPSLPTGFWLFSIN